MSYQDQLNAIITLTLSMIEAAEINNWDHVIQLEEKRQLKLKKIGEVDANTSTIEVIKNLKYVISLNKKLSVLSEIEKSACLIRFGSGKRMKKAVDAYTGY